VAHDQNEGDDVVVFVFPPLFPAPVITAFGGNEATAKFANEIWDKSRKIAFGRGIGIRESEFREGDGVELWVACGTVLRLGLPAV